MIGCDEGGRWSATRSGGVPGPARASRAASRRLPGTAQVFGCSAVPADCRGGVLQRRRRLRELTDAFRRLRASSPRRRRCVILDHLHRLPDPPRCLALRRRLPSPPVRTPTAASWRTLSEAHFGVLHRFPLAPSDDPHHAVRRRRVYRSLQYRERRVGAGDQPWSRRRSARPVKLE